MIAEHRAKGPTVVLDAGDALFRDFLAVPGEAEKAQARLLLEGMGEMGTAAFAVGDRDLAAGLDWLVREAARAKVPLLAANLVRADGSRPFAPSRLVEAGESRVGVIGLWGGGKLPEGLQAGDFRAAAKTEAERLRAQGATLVVALVHGASSQATDVASIAGIDFAIPSHEGSPSEPFQAGQDRGWVAGAGQRGRTLLRLAVHPAGAGPLVDEAAAERLVRERDYLRTRLADSEKRAATADEQMKKALEKARAMQQKRIAELDARIASAPKAEGRRFSSANVALGAAVADEPELGERVNEFLRAHGDAPAAKAKH